jgi:hypothetical protein
MAVHYSAIGKDFTTTTPMSELSGRDKLNLLVDLLKELGMMDDMLMDLDLITKFNHVYKTAQDKYWEK